MANVFLQGNSKGFKRILRYGNCKHLCSKSNVEREKNCCLELSEIDQNIEKTSLILLGKAVRQMKMPCVQRRHFFKIFYTALNMYDRERVADVGADRLCAEWILKCGGRIRWVGADAWVSEYNYLPPESSVEQFKLQDIDASDSPIMSKGFQHLYGVDRLKSLKLHNCQYLDDNCLKEVSNQKSLEKLQISSNEKVTGKGLLYLTALGNLTDLHLKDLPGVENPVECYKKLREVLPKCEILYVEVDRIV